MTRSTRYILAGSIAVVVIVVWVGLMVRSEYQRVSVPSSSLSTVTSDSTSSRYMLADQQIGASVVMQQPSAGQTAAWGDHVIIPKEFPADVWLYPSANTRVALVDASLERATLVQTTVDPVKTAEANLIAAYKQNGFGLIHEDVFDGYPGLQFYGPVEQGRMVQLDVSIKQDQGLTVVSTSRYFVKPLEASKP